MRRPDSNIAPGGPLLSDSDAGTGPLGRVAGCTSAMRKDQFCTCRCGAGASTACLGCILLVCILLISSVHMELNAAKCGNWFYGCPGHDVRCMDGVARSHRVQPGENCTALARSLGMPRFALVNQNTTKSCCESTKLNASDVSPSALYRVCWRPVWARCSRNHV